MADANICQAFGTTITVTDDVALVFFKKIGPKGRHQYFDSVLEAQEAHNADLGLNYYVF